MKKLCILCMNSKFLYAIFLLLMHFTFFNENITSIDNGKYCSLVVFKDLCQVFDSVDPSVLLVKLEYYGILIVENDCMVCILSKQI